MGRRSSACDEIESTSSSDSESSSSDDSTSATTSSLDSISEKSNTKVNTQNNSDRPLAGRIREPKVLKIRTADATKSTLSKKALREIVWTPQSRGVLVHVAEDEDRIHDAPVGATGFYSKMICLGVGVPIHPFFISILDSYGIAPGQLTPFAWCHMMGVYYIWTDLGFGAPSLNVWHHLYRIHPVSGHPYFYFFTKWPKGKNVLTREFPNSSGSWRERFFFLDIATGGPGLRDEFSIARSVPQASLNEDESNQVEVAYSLEDRTWQVVSKGRRICAMGKFSMKEDKDKLKALARAAKDKASGSNSKRKVSESTLNQKSPSVKKPRAAAVETRFESAVTDFSTKKTSSSIVLVNPAIDKNKKVIQRGDSTAKFTSGSIELEGFFEEISRAFSRSALEKYGPADSSFQKFHLSFYNTAMALHSQYELLNELDSIEGPLKEKVADLVRNGAKLEADLAAANKMINKKDVALEKLGMLKTDADNAVQALASDLESARKQHENEVEDLQGQILALHEKVESLSSENAKLKTGEGVDIEAIIDAPEFADIKDFLQDSTGDELIRRINEAHPEWDLSFLMDGGVESSTAHAKEQVGMGTDENRGVDPKEVGTRGVDPNEVGTGGVDPTEVGTGGVDPTEVGTGVVDPNEVGEVDPNSGSPDF